MQYDIVIAGGGMVGLALAALLGQQDRRVAVLESICPVNIAPDADFDLRVSAISRISQRLLASIGAWDKVLKRRACAYETMVVWDSTGDGKISFKAAELGEPDLGHIVENRVLQAALQEALKDYPTVELFCPVRITQIQRSADSIQVHLGDERILKAALLVGADGARSYVREWARFTLTTEDYGQQGLVCTVQTSLPHQATAWQRFMPTGPLAFLPLSKPDFSSIVWTLPADKADELRSWEGVRFKQALADALDYQLGDILHCGVRASFPLRGQHSQTYVQERIALVGDAAHTIHPLAGQGVNLGFKDALALAESLLGASDLGGLRVLRGYERARRGDNQLTQKAMEGFKLLFSNDLTPWQILRNQGLNALNQLPAFKYHLARQAMGL